MGKRTVSMKEIFSLYPGNIDLEPESIPTKVRIITLRKHISQKKLYKILAIFPEGKTFKILVNNDIGECSLFDQKEISFEK